MKMLMLITGGSGRLGKELVKLYPEALHPTRQELDVTNEVQVNDYVFRHRPQAIIHTAALTNVAYCEAHRQIAYESNVVGTKNLIASMNNGSSSPCFIYISTACVFHGDVGNYVETDLPYPTNYYGLTKLLGELLVQHSKLPWTIVRTNFVAREPWPYPKAFTDRFGTYLFASDVAVALDSIIRKRLTGVLHVCGKEKMSMYELAKITTPTIKPMTLTEYHGVPLTVDMSLSSIKLKPSQISRGE
jgi:dTDP-4-dehydrorhamnose reductase